MPDQPPRPPRRPSRPDIDELTIRQQVDAELLAFLEQERNDRERGFSNERLHEAIQRVADRQTAHEADDLKAHGEFKQRFAEHGLRIGNLEAGYTTLQRRVDGVVEDTGQHRIDELEKQLARRDGQLREARTGTTEWWKVIVGAAAGAIFLAIAEGVRIFLFH